MKYLVYILLLIEIAGGVYWYLASPDGYAAYKTAYQAYKDIQADVYDAQKELDAVDQRYKAWSEDPFWYEQYARTRLHKGYPDEHVYITRE